MRPCVFVLLAGCGAFPLEVDSLLRPPARPHAVSDPHVLSGTEGAMCLTSAAGESRCWDTTVRGLPDGGVKNVLTRPTQVDGRWRVADPSSPVSCFLGVDETFSCQGGFVGKSLTQLSPRSGWKRVVVAANSVLALDGDGVAWRWKSVTLSPERFRDTWVDLVVGEFESLCLERANGTFACAFVPEHLLDPSQTAAVIELEPHQRLSFDRSTLFALDDVVVRTAALPSRGPVPLRPVSVPFSKPTKLFDTYPTCVGDDDFHLACIDDDGSFALVPGRWSSVSTGSITCLQDADTDETKCFDRTNRVPTPIGTWQ